MDIKGAENERSYRSEYEREYMLGQNMRQMDSLIDDAWSMDHPVLRNAMIDLQEMEQGSAGWMRAAADLDRNIGIYLQSPMAEHADILRSISDVIRREGVYTAKGLTGEAALKTMDEEACETELKDVGRKLETLDMMEEMMQEGQDRLAEFSGMLEDTETYGWKGDEYRKLRDSVHAFLRVDASMSADEIAGMAKTLSECADDFSKTSGSDAAKSIADFSSKLVDGIDEKRKILGGKESLDKMQGRLDARMEELMDVAARHKAKDAGTRKKLSLNDLREMEDAGKPRRREIVRDHSHREVQRTRNNSMGKG